MCEPEGWLLQQANHNGQSRSGLGENTCYGAPPASAPVPTLDVNAACGEDVSCIVNELNTLYTAFDENNPNSAMGVTIRMTDDFTIWCGGACHEGFNDCRVSAALFNHRVLLQRGSRDVQVTMGRDSGIIFNQAAVEATLAKCYYMYDGATFTRVNRGCGCSSHHRSCDHPDSPYNSLATGMHPDADGCACDSQNSRISVPEHTTDQQCFWRGPAYLYPTAGHTENQLREMVMQRIENQAGPDEDVHESEPRHRQEYWNEVIMDGEVMLRELASDPRSVVTAFVYIRGHSAGRSKANRMSQQVVAEYGGSPIPVVELDPEDGARNGPFRVADVSLLELTSEPLADASAEEVVLLAQTSALLEHTSVKLATSSKIQEDPVAPGTSE